MAAVFFVALCVGLCASLAQLADGSRRVKLSVLFTPQERKKRRSRIVAAVLAVVTATALVIGGCALYRRMKARNLRRAEELKAELPNKQEKEDSGDFIYRAERSGVGGGFDRNSNPPPVDRRPLQKAVSQSVRCSVDSSDGGETQKSLGDRDDREQHARPQVSVDGGFDEVDIGPRLGGRGGRKGDDAAGRTTTTAFAATSPKRGGSFSRRRSLQGSSPVARQQPLLDEGADDTLLTPLLFPEEEMEGRGREASENVFHKQIFADGIGALQRRTWPLSAGQNELQRLQRNPPQTPPA